MKILGAHGTKSASASLTSIQINESCVVDAGSLIAPLGKELLKVKDIIITHSHIDHIADLPLMIDALFDKLTHSLQIHATKETIEALQKHIFNNIIWPDFSKIELVNSQDKAILFNELQYEKSYNISGVDFYIFKNNHLSGSIGFIINNETLFTSDTSTCSRVWELINENVNISKLIIETSFPNRLESLARASRHLCPSMLESELSKLKRHDIEIYINHIKEAYQKEIVAELNLLKYEFIILDDGDYVGEMSSVKCKPHHIDNPISALKAELRVIKNSIPQSKIKEKLECICNNIVDELEFTYDRQKNHINQLNIIGSSLSTENSIEKLLQMIINKSRTFTNADAGTLYMLSEDERSLEFKIVENDTLNIKLGSNGEKIDWPNVELFLENKEENKQMVAALSAIESKVVNIEDVYDADGFNFEGTKKFDNSTGYRSKSMLVIPMINNNLDVIGVLQLINAQDKYGKSIKFSKDDEQNIVALTSLAAVAITNVKMINDLKELLESFIKSIAYAVDQKSPYTGGHVQKVVKIALMITEALNEEKSGKYESVYYNEEEVNEIRISALMHDVGKITTPQHVMDKATKLETLYDRINVIRSRFEILKRDLTIDMMSKKVELINSGSDTKSIERLKKELEEKIYEIDDEVHFLVMANVGGEFMRDEDLENIKKIGSRKIRVNNIEQNILTEDEVKNLSIRKGTLTAKELDVMRDHVKVSNEMLEALPFPKNLRRVPEIAGGHHEKLNGKGYPKGLSADELTLESRILALSDIFEALSASDRPYKDGKKLSEVMKIIGFMVKDEELDSDLVQFFYDRNLHIEYAKNFLTPEQLDV